jgi:hypothetical protein
VGVPYSKSSGRFVGLTPSSRLLVGSGKVYGSKGEVKVLIARGIVAGAVRVGPKHQLAMPIRKESKGASEVICGGISLKFEAAVLINGPKIRAIYPCH